MWASIDLYSAASSPCCVGGKLYCNGKLLQEVILPNSLSQIKNYTFTLCDHITSVVMSESITTIGKEAFNKCSSLSSINISNNVTVIEGNTFSGCSSLTNITLPDSVTSIGERAFETCSSLSSINIPDSVVSIGSYAFRGCVKLTSVYCKPTTPPAGKTSMFDLNASGRKIYVPTASVDAYKSAQYWSNYADYIVGYDFEDDGGSNLITFTINDAEYQAEEGMTWEEFINSEYNIPLLQYSELYISNGYVYTAINGVFPSGIYSVTGHILQSSTQTIQNGATYVTNAGGGGSD